MIVVPLPVAMLLGTELGVMRLAVAMFGDFCMLWTLARSCRLENTVFRMTSVLLSYGLCHGEESHSLSSTNEFEHNLGEVSLSWSFYSIGLFLSSGGEREGRI